MSDSDLRTSLLFHLTNDAGQGWRRFEPDHPDRGLIADEPVFCNNSYTRVTRNGFTFGQFGSCGTLKLMVRVKLIVWDRGLNVVDLQKAPKTKI